MVQNKGILHIHLKEDIYYKVVILYKLDTLKLVSILNKGNYPPPHLSSQGSGPIIGYS